MDQVSDATLGAEPHRAEAVTLPQGGVEAYASVTEAVNEGLGQLLSSSRDWAVDTGDEVRALSIFDLWMALATGELSATVPVWRSGRERWQPAWQVPELACSLNLNQKDDSVFSFCQQVEAQRSFVSRPSTESQSGLDETPSGVQVIPVAEAASVRFSAPVSTQAHSDRSFVRSLVRTVGIIAVGVFVMWMALAPVRSDVPAGVGIRSVAFGRVQLLATRTSFQVATDRAVRLLAGDPRSWSVAGQAEDEQPRWRRSPARPRVIATPTGQRRLFRTRQESGSDRALAKVR